MNRWLGLVELVVDAVIHGATAVERVHRHVSERPLRIVAFVPPLAPPARGILLVQDRILAGVYGAVRGTSRMIGVVARALLSDEARGVGAAGASSIRGTEAEPPARHLAPVEPDPRLR